jgi:hypothetical protein
MRRRAKIQETIEFKKEVSSRILGAVVAACLWFAMLILKWISLSLRQFWLMH